MIWDAKLHTVSEKLSLWIFYLILGRFRLVLERHFPALYQRYSLLFAPYISRIPNVPKLPQNSVNGQKAPRSYGEEGDERNIMWVCFCCPLVAVASIGRRGKPQQKCTSSPSLGRIKWSWRAIFKDIQNSGFADIVPHSAFMRSSSVDAKCNLDFLPKPPLPHYSRGRFGKASKLILGQS